MFDFFYFNFYILSSLQPTMDTTHPRLPLTAARVTPNRPTATQPTHPRRLGECPGPAPMVPCSARLRPRPSIDVFEHST